METEKEKVDLMNKKETLKCEMAAKPDAESFKNNSTVSGNKFLLEKIEHIEELNDYLLNEQEACETKYAELQMLMEEIISIS